jgi:Dolichyl-phosphate-mannose-protein mannosyltransferase
VLAIQAFLSLRLVRANTAFQDEALYLWSGHLQWAHWLHGAPIPPFPAYFAGAPVIYPPIGAVADSIGGLAAARTLSLFMMLGATALLWGTAGRLFGRRAAFFAAMLFAVIGPTLHLGAFASIDALSMLLVALAAWCAVRAGDLQDATGWMLAAGAALALANATAYASVLIDPVVVLLALATAYPRPGGKPAFGRSATLLTVTATLLLAGALIGGSYYVTGFGRATVAQASGADTPLSVLVDSWSWTGLVAVAALCGVVVSRLRQRWHAHTWLLALLASAVLLAPAEHAILRSAMSLSAHVVAGAWFAAIAAGFAADRLIAAATSRWMTTLTCGACVIALAFPAALGASQSAEFAKSWPNSSSFITIFRPLAERGSGHLLVEDPSLAEYYLPAGSQWTRWSSTRNIILTTGGQLRFDAGTGGNFANFIASGYFSFVAVNFTDTIAVDHIITADLRRSHHYRIIDVVPYGTGPYVIWKYEQAPVAPAGNQPHLGVQPGKQHQPGKHRPGKHRPGGQRPGKQHRKRH